MFVVGLTGNYGAGKSLVLGMFKKLGALTVNADRIVGALLEERAVIGKLREILGEAVFDAEGRLLKGKVSDMIFSDPSVRLRVEDLLHPLVFEKINETLKGRADKVAVVEAPVIFERGYERRFDVTIAVYSDEKTALRRLRLKGIKTGEALKRLNAQMPAEKKLKKADYSIDNRGNIKETERQAKEIYEKLLASAGKE